MEIFLNEIKIIKTIFISLKRLIKISLVKEHKFTNVELNII